MSSEHIETTPALPASNKDEGEPEESEDPNIDGGWAWVVVAASFFINFLAAGTFMCFGALYVELLDYFNEARSQASLVAAVTGICTALAGPLSTFTIPRFGHRPSAMFGTFLVCTGLFISGFAPNIYFLMFAYGMLVGIGCGLVWIVFVVGVTAYFKKRRGLAQGISFCGGGLSYMIFPFMYRFLIQAFAWQGTMWIISGIWMHAFIAAALLRPVPVIRQPANQSSSQGRAVLKKWSFYMFLVAHFFFYVDMLTFVNILPDSARLLGHSTFNSGLLLTILGAPIIPVRLLGNYIVDRGVISPTLYICLVCLFMSVTAFLYPLHTTYWYLATIAVFRGCGMAIIVPLSTVVCAHVFGADRMTAAFGITVLADGAAGLCGPALAGLTFDATGSYTAMYMLIGSLSLLATCLLFVIHLYRSGKISQKHRPTTNLRKQHELAEVAECDSLHVSREVVSKPLSLSRSLLNMTTVETTVLRNELADSD